MSRSRQKCNDKQLKKGKAKDATKSKVLALLNTL